MFPLNVAGSTPRTILVSPEKPLFLLGRNGTGKSALMHSFRQQLAQRSVYLPGNRTSVFDAEGLSMTPSGRNQYVLNLMNWDNDPGSRWRLISGNQRNDKAVHDLTSSEIQYNIDITSAIKAGEVESNVAKLKSGQSPIDIINDLLKQANIGVQFAILKGELKATQNGNTYSFARMSDGERIALVLISEVVSADPGMTLIIDEPELHLHRAIVVPLIKSLVNLRKDCSFIISTHELDLPSEFSGSQVCVVRSATWDQHNNISAWDVDLIEVSEIPENLRTDLLGSRRKILFIEGGNESLDKPIYAVMFPNASVRPREGCREVARAVIGLRSTTELHHAEAYGLVDGDGMSAEQVTEYQSQGIYALSVYAVESLYYSAAVRSAVAERQAETIKSDPVERAALAAHYLNDAKSRALAALRLDGKAEHLASRIAERKIRDALLAATPNRESMISGASSDLTVIVPSPYLIELGKINALLEDDNLDGVIARYPVRESGALDGIAKALRFAGRADYESAALSRLSTESSLLNNLRVQLEPLSSKLAN